MDDLIRRQATYLALVEKGQASKRYKLGETWELNGEEIREVLDALPSAQPEIIRCKDCKYYKYGICMKIGANKSFYGFCDWAERGEQE